MKAPQLTIGMATCDDFDGVYFTLTSLMIHHPEILSDCEFVVVDNNPHSQQGKAVKAWLDGHVPNCTYHAMPTPFGTAPARNEVFRQAKGEFVLCIDCHVLIVPGAVKKLLNFLQENPTSANLHMGPLIDDCGRVTATHQSSKWSAGAWGVWAFDERGRDPDGEPFEIWQQGMGLFACRREAWVGFHPDFRGFGGCESYVMEKFRRQGGRVLCCPWLRWTHRFQRPLGVPYRVSRSDAYRNYLIGFRELGLDTGPVEQHYADVYKIGTPSPPKKSSPISNGSIWVLGDAELGSVKMRGLPLSEHLQCPLVDSTKLPLATRCDTAIAIKECSVAVRKMADRLIYDPLDVFWKTSSGLNPVEFWRRQYNELHFDDIIATSPACYDVMREALPDRVQVHLIPHHSDPRISETWFDGNGPIVYAGQREFLSNGLDRVRAACQMLGKDFVSGVSCDLLQGAALALALRLPPSDTPLNRHCKPQVKIANAIAANVPVVTTDCPAALSLYPQILSVPVDFTATQLADAMQRAMGAKRNLEPYLTNHFLSAMNRVLGLPAWIVYTASYGDSAAPAVPRERVPGVQYLCFTDNARLKSNVWSFRLCAPSQNPLMQVRNCKILAHDSVDCDASLWIDANLEVQSLEQVFQCLSADVAMRRHPRRNCIYEEAAYCKVARRGDPSLIDGSIARYREEFHPTDYGLWDTSIVLRRHNETTKSFNVEWWREVTSGTPQDQISLPVILRRRSIEFETLPPGRPRTVASGVPH